MLEAIRMGEELCGNKLDFTYVEDNRVGDHIWYVSDVRKFQEHYPAWQYRYSIADIMREIHEACTSSH
jgi:CDP-paratose 2-epimerase